MAERTVLVVDDEEMIRTSVAAYLELQGFHVLTAADGPSALEAVERCSVALVVLDLMLPGMSGEDVCRELRRRSRVPVIMLTAKAREADVIDGLGLGADDYVTKPFSVRELHARIEAVLRRSSDDLAPLAQRCTYNGGDLYIDFEHHEVRRQGQPLSLTRSEWCILATLATHPRRVFTRQNLIDLALGPDFSGYDRAVDTHIKNLRKKVETDPRHPTYIKTVHGMGYRFAGEG